MPMFSFDDAKLSVSNIFLKGTQHPLGIPEWQTDQTLNS